MTKKTLGLTLCFFLSFSVVSGQKASLDKRFSDFSSGIRYNLEAQVTSSKGATPLWLSANKHGLSGIDRNNGYFRAAMERSTEADSSKNWKFGFGLDAAVAYGFTSELVIQQMYAEAAWKKLRLSIGSKERECDLKPLDLSTGSQTFGINARPIPQIRLEVPEYLSITGKSRWASVKGHFGFGYLTESDWEKKYVKKDKYTSGVFYHSKAGFLKIGNEEHFPLTLEGGLEMACMFGGTMYNAETGKVIYEMKPKAKDFFNAVFGQGSDASDGDYANAAGNTVGSWLFRLNYQGKDWRISAYYDHFFEDHSAMFFEYGWFDGLLGVEAKLPKNPIVSNLVYEFVNTTYQSGPIYHDHTPSIPDQVSATDNYYNHTIQGWIHWGQPIGNPLFVSPLYKKDGTLSFKCNRFRAHHIGLSGNPIRELKYRLLYTHSTGWGTYSAPYKDEQKSSSILCELTYSPSKIGKFDLSGWSATLGFGLDRGKQVGNHTGFQFTIKKSGFLTK